MESWIAARLDRLAALEAARGWSRPITFTNWLTDDPLHHPDEPLETEDMVSVDAMHLHATTAWPGGFFASYHAYPYYPDFLSLQADLRAAADPYAAYLRDLRAHHAGQAVMITEFGVPSGLGDAHRGPLGRDQGNHSETAQGAMDAAMLRDIRTEGYAGGIVFEYIDEWFKRTWNTQDIAQPADRRALRRNVLTNEGQFGLVAAEPDRRPKVVLDGHAGEWRHNGSTLLLHRRGAVRELRATSDAGYVYLLVRRRGSAALRIGFDGNVELLLRARSARIRWASSADYLPAVFGVPPASTRWTPVRLILDRPLTVPTTGERRPAQLLDISRLRWGRSPAAGGKDDRVLADGRGSTIELRIPWAMLMFADPSSHRVFVPRGRGIVMRRVSGLRITVAPGGTARPYRWPGWNRVRWHERRKAGWSRVRRAFRAAAAG